MLSLALGHPCPSFVSFSDQRWGKGDTGSRPNPGSVSYEWPEFMHAAYAQIPSSMTRKETVFRLCPDSPLCPGDPPGFCGELMRRSMRSNEMKRLLQGIGSTLSSQ